MPNKFLSAIKLARLNVPASYLLPFFIASFGSLLGSTTFTDLKMLPLFFVGSITARGAGCIINDIFDKDFDSKVERTKNRPLANGSVSIRFALIQLIIFLIISALILILLPKVAIYTSLIAAIMTAVYPLMKRITYLPQVFLGLSYSMASLIGYASITNNISIEAITLYLAICSWTIGFDVIYGFMDIKDDKKINVKSMAILLENKNYKIWIMLFYIIFIVLFFLSYYLTVANLSQLFCLGIFLALSLLSWQVKTLDIQDPKNCQIRFKSNIYVGVTLLISVIHTKLYF
jgi:4-hydroxybenzoate polyprenyltransferase